MQRVIIESPFAGNGSTKKEIVHDRRIDEVADRDRLKAELTSARSRIHVLERAVLQDEFDCAETDAGIHRVFGGQRSHGARAALAEHDARSSGSNAAVKIESEPRRYEWPDGGKFVGPEEDALPCGPSNICEVPPESRLASGGETSTHQICDDERLFLTDDLVPDGALIQEGDRLMLNGTVHVCTCTEGQVGECEFHSVLNCPHDEPLHYHGDGCPACDMGEDDSGALESAARQDLRVLAGAIAESDSSLLIECGSPTQATRVLAVLRKQGLGRGEVIDDGASTTIFAVGAKYDACIVESEHDQGVLIDARDALEAVLSKIMERVKPGQEWTTSYGPEDLAVTVDEVVSGLERGLAVANAGINAVQAEFDAPWAVERDDGGVSVVCANGNRVCYRNDDGGDTDAEAMRIATDFNTAASWQATMSRLLMPDALEAQSDWALLRILLPTETASLKILNAVEIVVENVDMERLRAALEET